MNSIPKTFPEIGEKIYATHVDAVPYANKRTCTVERIDSDGDAYCEFPTYTDTEGNVRPSTRWYVSDWIAAGDTVIATDIPGYQHMSGQTVTVTSVNSEGSGRAYFCADGFVNPDYPGHSPENLAFYGAEKVAPPALAGPEEDKDAVIADLREEVASLTLERDRQALLRSNSEERLTVQQDRYSHDMREIERIMLEQKSEQSWCDDGWNEVVDDVNGCLTGGYEFSRARKLVKKRGSIKGECIVNLDVWVEEGDDADDPDNWKDEDGDSMDIDASDLLESEAVNNGWDDKSYSAVNVRF